jgi:hypothetical protein
MISERIEASNHRAAMWSAEKSQALMAALDQAVLAQQGAPH